VGVRGIRVWAGNPSARGISGFEVFNNPHKISNVPRIPPELSGSRRSEGNDPLSHLGQISTILEIDKLGCGEWTTLYEYQSDSEISRCSYSALLSSAQAADALKHDNWDLRIGSGGPSFSERRNDGVDVVEYDRFGLDGVEPLVYPRDFHGIKPRQFDLSEEFRLFHNLYHDRHNDRYIHISDRGNETIAAEVLLGQVREAWTKKFGWSIFRPLHEDDSHIVRQLHVPISESLGEFDVQVLFLVKLLVDSLNEAELARACPGGPADEKGISKFRRYLEQQKYPETDRDIGLLRTLQDLRSSGAVHAKGKNFDKIRKRIGLDIDSPKDVFRALISQVNQMLAGLSAYFVPDE